MHKGGTPQRTALADRTTTVRPLPIMLERLRPRQRLATSQTSESQTQTADGRDLASLIVPGCATRLSE